MHAFTYGPLMIALLLSSALIPAWGAEAGIARQMSGSSGSALNMQQQHQLSNMAINALHQISAAREDIAQHNPAAAHQMLDKASVLLDSLQTGLTATPVLEHTEIAQKHLEHDGRAGGFPDLIPIYTDLHTLQDFMPVKQRNTPDSTLNYPQPGLKLPDNNGLHTTDTALIYTEADLPIAHTRHAVDAAHHALDQHHWQRADNALKNAENGVVFMSTSVNNPFSAGRQSLLQTTRLLAAGEMTQARVELRRARSYLQHATQTTDSIARADADKLLQDASQLDAHIQNDDANLVNDAQTLWYRAAALAERSNAYLGNEWASVMHDQPIKARLIEARLALRDAAIDQFSAHQPAAAEAALAHTQNYLGQALKIARNGNQPQMEIRGVQKHVARLASTPPARRSQSRYNRLAGELGILIGQS
ncbi:MAG: YfdX family protein [Sulfuriferula sp.]